MWKPLRLKTPTRRRIASALCLIGIATIVVEASVHWVKKPVLRTDRFPQSDGGVTCLLHTKTSRIDLASIPFECSLEVCDANGTTLLNGKWTSDVYVERIEWQGNQFHGWNASSICCWGIVYRGRVFWPWDVCTDNGLEGLNGCNGVDVLYLSGPKLTDAGLLRLKGLPDLKTVILDTDSSAHVTRAGVMALKAACPTLDIRSNLLDQTAKRSGTSTTRPPTAVIE